VTLNVRPANWVVFKWLSKCQVDKMTQAPTKSLITLKKREFIFFCSAMNIERAATHSSRQVANFLVQRLSV